MIPALGALRRKHLVMLANLREGEIDSTLNTEVNTLDEALAYSSTSMYLEERAKIFETLASHGVLSMDSTAQRLPIDLTNEYLRVKSAGRL